MTCRGGAMKRSGKFYRKNEKEVMRLLGLKPTKNSGSGWIEKEDGQSESVLCQLKSTDANSIKINKHDLDTLMYNAAVSHKLPVFVIQFLGSNELYLLLKPDMLEDAAEHLRTGEVPEHAVGIDLDGREAMEAKCTRPIRSSSKARDVFNQELEKKYEKKRRAAT